MLEKLPFYGQALCFAALAVGLVVAAYALWPDLGQMRAQIAEYTNQYDNKQVEIQKGRAAEARLPELEAEIVAKQRELTDLQQILPNDRETGELLRYVKNLGDQSNLELKSFAPEGLKPAEFYKEFPIEMQVAGRYHDLGLFLDRVSKYSRIINVDNLRITGIKEHGKTILASLTATTFVYSDSGAEGTP
jgi:type IV pilus assembly protein PilO